MEEESSCYCKKRTVKKTSWTNLNSGRRYSICSNFRHFRKMEVITTSIGNIIPELLRKVNLLESEIARRKSKEVKMWICLVVSWIIIYLLL
ncbi:hypothetical protein CDL12_19706 [Handroanthus impetiginosus]|uniref:Uncharacterized protein n=1 Tax=Handroanthus impetiginosus TaxID=429701 RepID=A0A2G9GR85_9LAMI|nr:hypothetical protein CDL12_19706 [Handroanthus impetiginosus]